MISYDAFLFLASGEKQNHGMDDWRHENVDIQRLFRCCEKPNRGRRNATRRKYPVNRMPRP